MAEKKPVVRLSSTGPDYGYQSKKIEIAGLDEEEIERMNGVLNGHWWTTVRDGRLVFEPTRQPLPAPTEDADISPYWRGRGRLKFFQFDESTANAAYSFPHITIQHLCGYYWTKEEYKKQADKLESYGFSCLRSRRGDDGRFWEIWYLCGLFAARGELGKAISGEKDGKKKLDNAISFLCQNCSFGSLEVSIQRAAMVLDD